MEAKLNIVWLLVLIAGVLAAVGVFLAWMSEGGYSVTGWELVTDWAKWTDDFRVYLPIVSLILGVLAILLAVLGFVGVDLPASKLIVIIIGVLVILMPFITFSEDLGEAMKVFGIGVWIEIIAGILLVIVPILSMLKILPEE